jgi:4-hydroxy-tetrahydrodipicolinate reductase
MPANDSGGLTSDRAARWGGHGGNGSAFRITLGHSFRENEVAMSIKVCVAGATGWAGSELSRGIAGADDLALVAAVARRHAGQRLGELLGEPRLGAPIFASVDEALAQPCDVLVEYTGADSAKANILAALKHGLHVVVGSSGLSDNDYAQIDAVARERGRGVLACGNFALTAVLLIKFAEMAAKIIPQWELIDYASAGKPDAPSGTVRELAGRLGKVRRPQLQVPVGETVGMPETRGGTLAGSQVHAVRLPGFVLGAEAIFGMPDQTLTLRHNAGSSAKPYVDGALLAIRKVPGLVGLHRGLDAVLEL